MQNAKFKDLTHKVTPFPPDAKFIVMSDCHRGDGSAADEFAHNSLIYKCALEYYLKEGFTYIELGDAEELWGKRGESSRLFSLTFNFEGVTIIRKFYAYCE
jgi:hypothetical protein